MKNRKVLTIFSLFILTLTVMPMTVFGQSENDQLNGVSEKSLGELRKEVFQAEEDFYALYNKLNDDRDYNVRCRYETATGTRQKTHVCRARFVTKAFERHARRNRNDMSRVANQDADPILAEKTAIFEAKMETLMGSNPELKAAFDKYNDSRVRFMAKRGENN